MQQGNYSLQALQSAVKSGTQFKYLYFWGHQPSANGVITASCFSQWWLSPFVVDGVTYATAEHWMMASKAQLFGDKQIIPQILSARTPAQAKSLGRQVKSFDQQLWQSRCFELVCAGNQHKFSQHPNLREFLLNTKRRVLVEASPVDKIWGIGLAQDDPRAANPLLWDGQNLLGFALMEVRERLAAGG
ncbi:MAG: NADAR family protein [Limnobaculum xujianqingii]